MEPTEREQSSDLLGELQKPGIRAWAYILSQFSWFFFIGAFVASGFVFPRYHPAQVFTSEKPTVHWDGAKDPIIFTHATDVHLSACEPLKVVNTRALIQNMVFYKANFNLISGDMVDSYGEKNWPKIGHQVPEDWSLWKKIFQLSI